MRKCAPLLNLFTSVCMNDEDYKAKGYATSLKYVESLRVLVLLLMNRYHTICTDAP